MTVTGRGYWITDCSMLCTSVLDLLYVLQLVCRPAFDVELDRDVDQLLVIHCVFASPADLPMSLDETLHDTFCEFFQHI